MAYSPKDSNVAKSNLQVQTLRLPFTIAGSATSANVVVTPYDTTVLFINTAGVTQISTSTGALDSGEASPSMGTISDAGGQFGALVKVNETINKIVGAELLQLGGSSQAPGTITLANTTGLTANGNKIVLNVNSGFAYNSATTLTGCLVVHYIAAQ